MNKQLEEMAREEQLWDTYLEELALERDENDPECQQLALERANDIMENTYATVI